MLTTREKRGRWAIFYTPRDNHPVILLKDGAWTDPGNCMMREFGATFSIPRLFDTRRDAQLFLAQYNNRPAVEVGVYLGPLKPWGREQSIVYAAFDHGRAQAGV